MLLQHRELQQRAGTGRRVAFIDRMVEPDGTGQNAVSSLGNHSRQVNNVARSLRRRVVPARRRRWWQRKTESFQCIQWVHGEGYFSMQARSPAAEIYPISATITA